MVFAIYAVVPGMVFLTANAQVPKKKQPESIITAEWLRNSSLASNSPEFGAYRVALEEGERAFPAYEVILADEKSNPILVQRICQFLAMQKADRTRFLPLLRKRLMDPFDYVRLWAIPVIGQIGTKDDLPILVAFLSSEHNGTVKMAASAVASIGGDAAMNALDIWLLCGGDRNDADLRKTVTIYRDELKGRLDKQKSEAKK